MRYSLFQSTFATVTVIVATLPALSETVRMYSPSDTLEFSESDVPFNAKFAALTTIAPS